MDRIWETLSDRTYKLKFIVIGFIFISAVLYLWTFSTNDGSLFRNHTQLINATSFLIFITLVVGFLNINGWKGKALEVRFVNKLEIIF